MKSEVSDSWKTWLKRETEANPDHAQVLNYGRRLRLGIWEMWEDDGAWSVAQIQGEETDWQVAAPSDVARWIWSGIRAHWCDWGCEPVVHRGAPCRPPPPKAPE